MKASISTHIIKIREYVDGIKHILMYFNNGSTKFTVDLMKHYYKEFYNKELKGNSFRNWIQVFDRGAGWDFTETIVYHSNCSYVEYQYKDNGNLILRNGTYLRHSFI